MSENIRKHLKDLEFVSRIKCPKTRKVLLKYISKYPKYYHILHEISNNLIKGNISLKKAQKRKLAKHKKLIYQIAKKRRTSKRKSLVVQSGGWMWILPLVSTIVDLIK